MRLLVFCAVGVPRESFVEVRCTAFPAVVSMCNCVVDSFGWFVGVSNGGTTFFFFCFSLAVSLSAPTEGRIAAFFAGAGSSASVLPGPLVFYSVIAWCAAGAPGVFG